LTPLLNTLILLAWYAGHCELWTATINRLYSYPLPFARLRRFRRVHDLALVAFPLILVGWIGLSSPGVLVGGRWADLLMAWKVYFGVCSVGAASLVIHAIRRAIRRPPREEVGYESRVIDVAAELGGRPIGDGPHQGMARMWFNETFELDLTTRTLAPARLPSKWDGLSIVQLSDLHLTGSVDRPYFDEVVRRAAECEPDLVVCTGDLVDDIKLLDWLPATLGRLDARLGCWFILGNHDWHARPETIRETMVGLGWHDVAGGCRRIEHRGRILAIGGSERPWMGDHPDFSTVPDADFRLLLSHTPDDIGWAREHDVDLMFAGHLHGGQVCLPLIGPVYSPSRHGCRFAAGTFLRPPTLLVVTRGVSGRHPLRWRCRPELANVVLRAS